VDNNRDFKDNKDFKDKDNNVVNNKDNYDMMTKTFLEAYKISKANNVKDKTSKKIN